jgi:hypothetical protein
MRQLGGCVVRNNTPNQPTGQVPKLSPLEAHPAASLTSFINSWRLLLQLPWLSLETRWHCCCDQP